MDPPQPSFVPLKKRATIHGHELGTLSRPPTILRKRRMLGYKRERLPQSAETVQRLCYETLNLSVSLQLYRKILIINLRLLFVQKAVFQGLFSGELIFGGGYDGYYWKKFCVSK